MDAVAIILTLGFMVLGFALDAKNKAKKIENNKNRASNSAESNMDLFSLFGIEQEDAPVERVYHEPVVEDIVVPESVERPRVEDMIIQMAEVKTEPEDEDPDSIANFVFDKIGDIKIEEKKSLEIDPEMMIIYSEILKPKFKETLF